MKKISMLMIAVHYYMMIMAQSGTGIIKGQVVTADNKPAENVTVVLKSTKKNTLTAEDGSFLFRNAPQGMQEIEVSLVG